MNDQASVLNALELALFSRYHQAWQTHQLRGSLDPRRCYRSLGGSTDVFRRKDIREERKSAVSIVVDLSGSMGGDKGIALGKMVDGFQEIFRMSQVNWELSGFATHGPKIRGVNRQYHTERMDKATSYDNAVAIQRGQSTKVGGDATYQRRSTLDHVSSANLIRFKRFGAPTPVEGLGKYMDMCTGGGTADALVYQLAMERLAKQEESTKLLIYLGDGVGDGMGYIRQVNDEAETKGIISMGIGLGYDGDCVKPWAFDTCIHVPRIEDLSRDAFVDATNIINQLKRDRCK